MMPSPDGQRFGRLVVLREVEPVQRPSYRGHSPCRTRRVECRCDCGNVSVYALGNLKGGNSQSCGCLRTEQLVQRARKHGESASGRTAEYTTWKLMKQRCENPENQDYHLYGGRGIRVCERWHNSFENFLADMGRKPSRQHSIDRMDNDGNYEPGNCRWATVVEQRRNQRRCAPQTQAVAP